MALIDDINALPTTVGDGQTGHLQNHATIHAALKDHETRLGARDMIGTGAPEGRTAATVGTTYTDTAATNGALRWIKATGTGTTGWRVTSGDTGWRDITTLLSTPPTGGNAWVRRTPDSIILRLVYFNQENGSSTSISLPTGLSPGVRTAGILFDGSGASAGRYTMSFGGALALHTNTGTLDCAVTIPAEPNRAWPTTYIGTPA